MLNHDEKPHSIRIYATRGVSRYHVFVYTIKGQEILGSFNNHSPKIAGLSMVTFFEIPAGLSKEQRTLDDKFRALTPEEEQEFLSALKGE